MDVISGKEDKKPALIALYSVNSEGKHLALCRNTMRLSMVAYNVLRMAAWVDSIIY